LIKNIAEQLGDQCREEYQARIKELDTQEAIDAWTRTLEDDLAEQHDLDAQGNAAKKVVDIEDELVAIVCSPRFIMLSGCLLTIPIRAAALREIMSTFFSSPALSTHTVFKRKRCLGLVWVLKRCAQCWWTTVSSSHSISCSMI